MITFVIHMLIVSCLLLIVLSIIDAIKSKSKSRKMKRLNRESSKFLNSEEGFQAEVNVANMCNELGITLESDKEDDGGEYITNLNNA